MTVPENGNCGLRVDGRDYLSDLAFRVRLFYLCNLRISSVRFRSATYVAEPGVKIPAERLMALVGWNNGLDSARYDPS